MEMECDGDVCRVRKKKVEGLQVAALEVGREFAWVEWGPRGGLQRFEVQLREGGEWRTLSDQIKGCSVRKKNLQPDCAYAFRVRGWDGAAWAAFSEPCELRTLAGEPPARPLVRSVVAQDDGKCAATLTWDAQPGASVYEVQMRPQEPPLEAWVTVSDKLTGLAVRKKNLPPATDYLVRVRARAGDGEWGAWSALSAPVRTPTTDACFRNLLGDSLLRGAQQVPIQALAGKLVAVYFSAHWCPPCRQQTAMMKGFYETARAKGLPLEVVFVSADRDEAGFKEYFGEMPWLALPYTSPKREQIMAMYKVSGIPKLMVFGPTGQTITDNAAGVPLSEQTVQAWARQAGL